MSGGKRGLALAGAVSLALGGSIGALLIWLAGVSWVVAALVALACVFLFYMEGAYRVWDNADRRAKGTQSALEAEQAKPRGPTMISIEGGTGNMAWDNKMFTYMPPSEEDGTSTDQAPG